MDDLISRQAAIDAMNQIYCHVEMIRKRPVTKGEQALFLDMRETIKALPSAEPRKKGKWLLIDAGYYDYVKCSQCGETLVWGKNFCPNCGACMREGEEE